MWQQLWASFKAVWGTVTGPVALPLAILGPLYLPAATVQIGIIRVVVIVMAIATALATAWDMVATARRQARRRLPRAHDAVTEASGRVTLLPEPSELFGFNALVAIYYTEGIGGRSGAFERLVGVGRVSNIQRNGYIQIALLKQYEGHAELWSLIRSRDLTPLEHVVVKPSVPYDRMEDGGTVQ